MSEAFDIYEEMISSVRRRIPRTSRRKIRDVAAIRPKRIEDVIDEPTYLPDTVEHGGAVLGTYSTEEWILADFQRDSFAAKQSLLQVDATLLIPVEFELASWVEAALSEGEGYMFLAANRCMVHSAEGLIKINVGRGKLDVEARGKPEYVKRWVDALDAQFKRAENLIEWIYSPQGHSIAVPLNYRPALKNAYPFIEQDLMSYIDDYLNSDASVIILIGKPGTGKTTFIKNLIHRSKSNAKVAYDESVMKGDSLFASFIEDDSRFLVMEDADAFLAKREDGNTMMHKFLNVSDGLISAADKKLVFSTNLDSVKDIDEALMRPGRCFGVIHFRPLTLDEARAVIKEAGAGSIPALKDGKPVTEVTLADLFSQQANTRKKRSSMGFI